MPFNTMLLQTYVASQMGSGMQPQMDEDGKFIYLRPTGTPKPATVSNSEDIDQDPDPRFEYEDLEGYLTERADANTAQVNTAGNVVAEYAEEIFDNRYLGIDSGYTSSDNNNDIAYIRIVKFVQGKIYTAKQVFPKVHNKSNDTEDDTNVASYKKMIIMSKSVSHTERNQIMKSNKVLHAFFFDAAPEVLNISGALKTNWDDPWDQAMILLWDNLLRATTLAQHECILEFGMAGEVYWGYPLTFQTSKSSSAQYVSTFNMQILIVDRAVASNNIDTYVKDIVGTTMSNNMYTTAAYTLFDRLTTASVNTLSASSLDNLPTARELDTSLALSTPQSESLSYLITQTPGVATIPPSAPISTPGQP